MICSVTVAATLNDAFMLTGFGNSETAVICTITKLGMSGLPAEQLTRIAVSRDHVVNIQLDLR